MAPRLAPCEESGSPDKAADLVVRDRIELSTFRFSEGLSSTREPPFDAAPQPVYQHSGLSGACGSSLAGVPTCAGKCRLVRVTGVLASWDDRTCVALVLASWDRVPSTRAPPAQAPPSPAAYDRQPQHPPPWPTRLPEPAKHASHTVTSGIVGSDPARTDRRIFVSAGCVDRLGFCVQITHYRLTPRVAQRSTNYVSGMLTGTRSSIYRGGREPGHRRDPLLGHVPHRPEGP